MGTLVDLGALDQRLTDLQRPAASGFSPGLCRAVAERLGVDPLILRVLVVALTFAAGLGIVLYVWGTVLTARVGGQAPIERHVPTFGRWPRRTQLWVVAISSLVVVISAASNTSVALGPAIIILSLVWLSRRRSVSLTGTGAATTPPVRVAADVPDPAEAVTVEEWRARLGAHAARRPTDTDRLPVVDLYGPEPGPDPTPPAARRKTSWFGALAIVALGLLTGLTAGSVDAGVDPVLMAMAVCTATVGISMLAWALVIRSRRLPFFLIAVVLAGAAVTSAYAVQHAAPGETVAASPTDDTVIGDDLTYEFVADGRGLVDLSHLSLDDVRTVHVEATASNVRILLPGEPAGHRVSSTMSSIDLVETPTGNRVPVPASGISLDIIATMSTVTVEFPA